MFDTFKGMFSWHIASVSERPALAAHIGEVIAMWSIVEQQESQLLSHLLKAEATVGATLFSSIRAEAGRLAMIQSAATRYLTAPLAEEFAQLKRKIQKVGSYRDQIAHNIWAVPSEMPDALVLMDSRTLTELTAQMTAASHGGKYEANDTLERHFNASQTWRELEFLHVKKEISSLLVEIQQFVQKISPPPQIRIPPQ